MGPIEKVFVPCQPKSQLLLSRSGKQIKVKVKPTVI